MSRGPWKNHTPVFNHPLYLVWHNIRQRCYNPKCPAFENYGGRGITMLAEWKADCSAFLDWIEVNLGPRPDGLTLERIDNAGHYVPGNLEWGTRADQAANRRSTIWLEVNGVPYPLKVAIEEVLGLTKGVSENVRVLLRAGKSLEWALRRHDLSHVRIRLLEMPPPRRKVSTRE